MKTARNRTESEPTPPKKESSEASTYEQPTFSGKWAILAMVSVSLALAGYSWYFRWKQSQTVLAHWGAQAATLIRTGESVELWWLEDVSSPTSADPPQQPHRPLEETSNRPLDVITIHGKVRRIRTRHDLSTARGLIHARHHLVHPRAFVWSPPSDNCEPTWDCVLRFRHHSPTGDEQATLAFDFHCQQAWLMERNELAGIEPIATDLNSFLQEWRDTP